MNPLDGKAIVITGAGRGIGEAYARRFAQLGASIVVNDVDAANAEACAQAIVAAGGTAVPVVADISEWSGAGSLVTTCLDAFGHIDGLVNNAALFAMGTLDEYAPGDLDPLLAVNILGTVHCAVHAAKAMRKQGRGAILNVTSGAHMGIPGMGSYGATKGAVASLTYAWAMELEGSGVRVNCISPMAQTFMGEITQRYLRDRGHENPPTTAVQPSANADVAAYLLSDAAAAIHGQIVRIENEQLSLVAHPAVVLPGQHQSGGWDFAAIEAAFAGDFVHRQVPLGIIGVKVNSYGPASELWNTQEAS